MLRVTLAVATILLGACSEPFIVFAGGPLEGKVEQAQSEPNAMVDKSSFSFMMNSYEICV